MSSICFFKASSRRRFSSWALCASSFRRFSSCASLSLSSWRRRFSPFASFDSDLARFDSAFVSSESRFDCFSFLPSFLPFSSFFLLDDFSLPLFFFEAATAATFLAWLEESVLSELDDLAFRLARCFEPLASFLSGSGDPPEPDLPSAAAMNFTLKDVSMGPSGGTCQSELGGSFSVLLGLQAQTWSPPTAGPNNHPESCPPSRASQ
mmetsp:Transcript_53605/g.149119  ORF Transcript_53605/g.149119 Transcript_53605/m.149119 type:complete len:207 (-) Transcript_53605:296-916(-)